MMPLARCRAARRSALTCPRGATRTMSIRGLRVHSTLMCFCFTKCDSRCCGARISPSTGGRAFPSRMSVLLRLRIHQSDDILGIFSLLHPSCTQLPARSGSFYFDRLLPMASLSLMCCFIYPRCRFTLVFSRTTSCRRTSSSSSTSTVRAGTGRPGKTRFLQVCRVRVPRFADF